VIEMIKDFIIIVSTFKMNIIIFKYGITIIMMQSCGGS